MFRASKGYVPMWLQKRVSSRSERTYNPGSKSMGRVARFGWVLASGSLRQIESVEVHNLIPGGHEVVNKFSLSIGATVHLGQGPELGVRSKY